MTETGSDSGAESLAADVRVGFVGSGGERRVVIQNLGPGVARDVGLALESEDGKSSPLVDSEVGQKLPVERLGSRELVALTAVITTGTGLRFRAEASWTNADGSDGSVKEILEV